MDITHYYISPRIEGSSLDSAEWACSSKEQCSAVLRQQHHHHCSQQKRINQIPFSHSSSSGHPSILYESIYSAPSSYHSGETECFGRCSVTEFFDSGRMGTTSKGQGKDPQDFSSPRGGPNGNSFQFYPRKVRFAIHSPRCDSNRCLDSGLESVEANISVSPSISGCSSSIKSTIFQGSDDSCPKGSPPPDSSFSPSRPQEVLPSFVPSSAEGQGCLERGWQSLVLSLDSVSFLRTHLAVSHKPEVVERLLKGKRASTLYQNNVSWRAFQDFVKVSNPVKPDSSLLLEFCIWLRDSRNLATNTIMNYKAAVGQVLEKVFNINCNSWEFSALKSALFLEKPPNPPRIPSWDINKVLILLQSQKYNQFPPDKFCSLKKTLFLVAMATGNRVSELAHIYRTGLDNIQRDSPVRLCVAPGFLYKNQRLNRTPPDIQVIPLLEGPDSICPVNNLVSYLELSSPPSRGPLFLNSKTGRPLHAGSVSKLICELIEEADPGCFPQAHDVRRSITSIAWARGFSSLLTLLRESFGDLLLFLLRGIYLLKVVMLVWL